MDAAAASAITASTTTFDGIEGLEWTPDGRILYASMSPNGSYDLWTMKPDGSDRQPLVVNAGANLNPHVSRAGRSVVYSSDRGTNLFQIWHTGIPGGSARQLTSEQVVLFRRIYRQMADGSSIMAPAGSGGSLSTAANASASPASSRRVR